MITLLSQSTINVNHYKFRVDDNYIVYVEQHMEEGDVVEYIIKDEYGWVIDNELEDQLIDYIRQN